ncbi:hypothetical protein Sango_2805900 [Sesamum angolense]|uniref:Uncharacterized protein n=1 Tax=Sesamum angolense TaxID=2727404 RepID=A0AAE1VZU6_9LAMI|nr:hypothetical protein Sango_2805900 [Sesamum angolense]
MYNLNLQVKGYLGALDGTFIEVRVPEHEKGRYRTPKGQVAINVLGVYDPNMQFIMFLLDGKEVQWIVVFYVKPSTEKEDFEFLQAIITYATTGVFIWVKTPSLFLRDPTAKGMRHKSWHFFTTWKEIFGKDWGTGDQGSDLFKESNDIRQEEQEDTQECYVPTAEWNPEFRFVGPSEEPPISFNMSVDLTVNSPSVTK